MFWQAIVIVLVLTLVLGLAGFLARRRLRAQHPPIGRMINVGGYQLHLHSLGEGGPAVVLDAGIGEAGLSWAALQPEVARFARAVFYDRAGLGWSDSGPRPRTASVMVDELHTLLQRSGIPGPYVLVGASFGGLLNRLYARRYPEDVAGMVLVDAAHEEQYTPELIQQTVRRMGRVMPLVYAVLRLFIWSGLPAIVPRLRPVPGYFKLPPEARETYGALLAADSRMVTAQADELSAVMESHSLMRAARVTSLGDIPLVVLRHGLTPKQMTPELTELMESTHQRLQAELAAQSTNGRLTIAENSGHAIQFDQPELVVAAIREVVEAVRGVESGVRDLEAGGPPVTPASPAHGRKIPAGR